MSKILKLQHQFGVANLISCVTKIAMVFHKEKVQTNVADELGNPYPSTGDESPLYLKGY